METIADLFAPYSFGWSHAKNMWTDHSECDQHCDGQCTVWLIGVYPDPVEDDAAPCPQCGAPCGNLFILEWMYSDHDCTQKTCHGCMRILVGAEEPSPVPMCDDC